MKLLKQPENNNYLQLTAGMTERALLQGTVWRGAKREYPVGYWD